MTVSLGANSYGKSRVRLVHVDRGADRHELADLSIDIQLEGDFERAHTAGDNSLVVATDTMKNTVYALARREGVGTPERFGVLLAEHFLQDKPQVHAATVRVSQVPWKRIRVDDQDHRWAFLQGGGGERRVEVRAAREAATTIEAGIEGLVVLKTTESAFEGFARDEFTTLPETGDRILSTIVTARWRYAAPPHDSELVWSGVREALLEVFATRHSPSVQQTLFDMAEEALGRFEEIAWLRLELPNRHCLLVDLSPFGMDNPGQVFVPTDEPHGLICATVERS